MVALVLGYLLVQSNLIPLVRDAYMGSRSAHFRAAFEAKLSQYSSRYGKLVQDWGNRNPSVGPHYLLLGYRKERDKTITKDFECLLH